ncbi:MAG: hypothetical protein RL199_287 [Pseudomonadota bacterium]
MLAPTVVRHPSVRSGIDGVVKSSSDHAARRQVEHNAPTADRLVTFGIGPSLKAPADAADLQRLEAQRTVRKDEADDKAQAESDAAKARRAEERRARREAAVMAASESTEADDTKGRARRLVAAVDATRASALLPPGRPVATGVAGAASFPGPFRSV